MGALDSLETFPFVICMNQENITFKIDSEKRVVLDAIAAGIERDRSYVLNEAISL